MALTYRFQYRNTTDNPLLYILTREVPSMDNKGFDTDITEYFRLILSLAGKLIQGIAEFMDNVASLFENTGTNPMSVLRAIREKEEAEKRKKEGPGNEVSRESDNHKHRKPFTIDLSKINFTREELDQIRVDETIPRKANKVLLFCR